MVALYAILNTTLRFYENIAIWRFTASAAQQFTAMQKTRIPIGTQDLKIASIAIAAGATFLRRNPKDFIKIADLLIDEWTA